MSRLRHHRDETPRSNYLGGSNQGSHLPALLGPGRVRQLRDTSVYREGADAYRICSVPGESILALVGQLIFQARCRAFRSLDSVAIDGFTARIEPGLRRVAQDRRGVRPLFALGCSRLLRLAFAEVFVRP